MDWYDFETSGYLTKERHCGPSRTRLTGTHDNEEKFGVSIPNKIHGLYYNYLIEHSIVEKDFFWKVENLFGDVREDSWSISVNFSQNESKVMENMQKTLYYYTNDSVLKALRTTPDLASFITNLYGSRIFNNKTIHSMDAASGVSLHIYGASVGPTYSEIKEREDSEALFSYARLISSQLRRLSIDTSKLVKKPKEEPLLPKWLENTLRIGAKVGIKYICATIGAKIDFPDFGGDSSNNGPDFGYGDGGFDIGGDDGFDVGGDDGFDVGGDDGYDIGGIAFQGKHFDGYEDMDKTISVPIMGGGGNGTLHVYKKHGSSTIYVSDGTCYPVSTAGSVWITVGSHKFEVSKIKNKV